MAAGFSIFVVVTIAALTVRSLHRTWGRPKAPKPSINSGVAEKAALGGLLAALFIAAGRSHNNRKDLWS